MVCTCRPFPLRVSFLSLLMDWILWLGVEPSWVEAAVTLCGPYLAFGAANWESLCIGLSLVIGILSVVWLTWGTGWRTTQEKSAAGKAGKGKPTSKPAAVETAPVPKQPQQKGQSLATLKAQAGKKKGPAAPSHPLFTRLFKSSSGDDASCFALSPDNRVRNHLFALNILYCKPSPRSSWLWVIWRVSSASSSWPLWALLKHKFIGLS